MSIRTCPCPYLPCPIRGNCEACMAKHRGGPLPNCMEKVAEDLGAKLPLRFPKTEVLDDAAAVARRTAEILRETLREKPDALLCFPAGSTVVPTCAILCEMQARGEINFRQARFVSLDEWVGLADTSENCTAFLRKHLYRPLGIPPEHLTLFHPDAPDLIAECKRVDTAICEGGGIDLMILGIGMNGHLGLNEPGESFDSYAKVVTLSDTTKHVGQKYFTGETELSRGITLGVRQIYESRRVVLQVTGDGKKDIIHKMYHAQPTIEIPATVMTLLNDGLVVMDKAAAARIMDIL